MYDQISYQKIQVSLTLREKLCGGIPKNPDLIKTWLELRGMPDQVEATTEAMTLNPDQEIEESTERAWTGFKSDDKGLYIEGRQVKALLKESANVTGVTVKIRGAKNYITNGVFVKPDRLYLGKAQPDGYDETVCHITGPMGKRSALKRFDWVSGVTLIFELWLLERFDAKDIVPVDVLQMLMEHGQESGLGANRSQGYGQFDLDEWGSLSEE